MTQFKEAIEREIAYWESAGYSEGWANHARNTSVPLLRTILAALEPSETLQAQLSAERHRAKAMQDNFIKTQVALDEAEAQLERVTEALQVGEEVTAVYEAMDPKWRDDWIDWSGFVAGIQFDLRAGSLNYTVSDHWPPKNNGDLTDGFYEGELARKALAAPQGGV
jgi:hypothetical protein